MGVQITINDALGFLDPDDDRNWTDDGLPRMDIIERLMGDKSINRKDVTDADPEFCREIAIQWRADKVLANEMSAKRLVEENKIDEDSKVQTPQAKVEEKKDEQSPQKGRQEKAKVSPEESLRVDIQTLSEEIESLSTERSEVDKAINLLKKAQERLQQKSFSQHSAAADMKARMDFVKSQNEARARRFEKGRKILAIIGKDGLNPKSKLDMAMTRKTARGTRRPPPRTPKQ